MRIPFSSCKCFPRCCRVVVYQRLNADLMAYIDKLRNAEPEGRKRSNELGWQSEDFDFGVPVVAEFATLALERARQYGLAHSWRFPSHMQLAVWDLWANANGRLAIEQASIADGHVSGLCGTALAAFIPRWDAVEIAIAFTEMRRRDEAAGKGHIDDRHAGLEQ